MALPLIMTAVAIAALLILVLKARLPAFLALLIVALGFGLGSGMAPTDIINSVKNGMGGTLGFVAIVVGLGAMMGVILEKSGGVEAISETLLSRFGEKRAPTALGFIGFLVAIPVFFDVAFIILMPMLLGLKRKSSRPLIYFAIPLLAGLAVTHAFIPPTPGPIAVAELLGADLGYVILFGIMAGIPAMIVGGPLLAQHLSGLEMFASHGSNLADFSDTENDDKQITPELSFASAMSVIALPLTLIFMGTFSSVLLESGIISPAISGAIGFIGHPFTALILAVLYAWYVFGIRANLDRQSLHNAMVKALEPAGVVILVTGAGGAFKQILVDSGAGKMLAESLAAGGLPIILFAFIIAVIVRVAQGSATVAMITAAGLTAPVAELAGLSGAPLALLVIAVASGASVLSHVNDSGFWLVSRYLNLTETQTLRSWTVCSTLIGLTGFGVCCILSVFIAP